MLRRTRYASALAFGDITRWYADAITTSSNVALCGNRTPSYWRFRVASEGSDIKRLSVGFSALGNNGKSVPFHNIDGQVHHGATGVELQLQALDGTAIAKRLLALICVPGQPYLGALCPSSAGGRVACYAGFAVQGREPLVHCAPIYTKYRPCRGPRWPDGAHVARARCPFASDLCVYHQDRKWRWCHESWHTEHRLQCEWMATPNRCTPGSQCRG